MTDKDAHNLTLQEIVADQNYQSEGRNNSKNILTIFITSL
jgi:hypothetical protein